MDYFPSFVPKRKTDSVDLSSHTSEDFTPFQRLTNLTPFSYCLRDWLSLKNSSPIRLKYKKEKKKISFSDHYRRWWFLYSSKLYDYWWKFTLTNSDIQHMVSSELIWSYWGRGGGGGGTYTVLRFDRKTTKNLYTYLQKLVEIQMLFFSLVFHLKRIWESKVIIEERNHTM